MFASIASKDLSAIMTKLSECANANGAPPCRSLEIFLNGRKWFFLPPMFYDDDGYHTIQFDRQFHTSSYYFSTNFARVLI